LDEAIDLRDATQDSPKPRAADARSRFLVNTSQEIRTQVNDVLANTATVLDSTLSLEQRGSLVAVQQSAESLLTLVNNLLDVSRLEDGEFELVSTPFRLRRTIDHLVKMLAPDESGFLAEADDSASAPARAGIRSRRDTPARPPRR
jgi:signal transduction histidine kinase